MKLCVHVIKNDTGLAPNPFHGYCTSALCTPSHVGARLCEGDWLIGNSPKRDGRRLVYAMRIVQVLNMNEYFNDERFTAKKPDPDGPPEQQCGDNLYRQSRHGDWERLPSAFHDNPASFSQDIGKKRLGSPVFVSNHFYYFGSQRVALPDELTGIAQLRQGLHYEHGELAVRFVAWIESHYKPGVFGPPRDMSDHRPFTRAVALERTERNAGSEPKLQTHSRSIGGNLSIKPICR